MQSFIRTSSNNCSSEASDILGGFPTIVLLHIVQVMSTWNPRQVCTRGEFPRLVPVYAGVCVRELEFHAENHDMERLLHEVYFTDSLHTSRTTDTHTWRHHTQTTQARFSHTDHASRIA